MSRTQVFQMDPDAPDPAAMEVCARILREGGLVAFPTETVYGLGADALSPEAVGRIFIAKGRPQDNPLIVHASGTEQAFRLASHVPPAARSAARAFWPGPLTLILPKGPEVPLEATGGLSTVAVRVPSHPVALALIERFGGPIAAPSANASGRPSPTRAEDVLEDLDGKIDAVIDAGECRVGLESTVLDVTVDPPEVLRLGGVALEALGQTLGRVTVAAAGVGPDGAPRSPGAKYRHYAPRAAVWVVTGAPGEVAAAVDRRAGEIARPIGLLVSGETARLIAPAPGIEVFAYDAEAAEGGPRLFAGLRALDRLGVGSIFVEALPEAGIGRAFMDRALRAAEGRVIDASRLDQALGPLSPGGSPR